MNDKHDGDGHVGGAHELHEVPKVLGVGARHHPGHEGEDPVGGQGHDHLHQAHDHGLQGENRFPNFVPPGRVFLRYPKSR